MAGNADINPYTRFQAFQDDIADYFENRVEAQEFFLSPKAALIADHWIENKIEIQENCAVKSLELYYPKLRIYCFRFALMLHLLEGYENENFGGNAPDISPETMIRAIYLTEFYEKQYRHIVFRNHETTGDYLKVKSVIERRAKQGFESTLGDLRNYSRVVKGMTKTRLNQVIQYLIKVGQIFEIEGARTSRYTTIDPNKSTKDKYSIDNNEQLKTAGVTTSEEPTEENILSNLDTFKVSMLKEADISLAEQKDYSETIAKNKAFQDKFNKRFKPKARKPELTQEEYNDKRDKEFALQEVYNVKNLQKPKDITENVDSQPNQNKAKKKKKKSFGDL